MTTTLDGGFSGGRIEPVELEREMQSAYLDYAMSVIVGRALPSVQDGLKPVHRRVLFAMQEMGLRPDRPLKKSARVVGDTMGKYHPHGDSSIYDTVVRMVQPFSLRYPLIEGQGNFGSIDGDNAAAMRYTECRLNKLAMQMLRDIGANTVDFGPNYDQQQREPLVLPSRFPNLIVNGSSGIAVGMATNMAPHNLGEAIDAITAFIDDQSLTVEQLMTYIKGPDFPTGGIIYGMQGIREAYNTGRGKVVTRARAHVEQLKMGKTAIIVTEIPYQVNKTSLINKIVELVQGKVITEISGMRDESDKRGMRIVIELKREAIPKVVLTKLYKHTQMQTTFGVNNIALVNGIPKLLNLRDLVYHYVEFQREVLTRRTKHELDNAKRRAHILEGLLIALSNIDRVIEIIRGAADTENARTQLMAEFSLSEEQAHSILELRLARLTKLSVNEIKAEHEELLQRIAYLISVLEDESILFGILKDELAEIRSEFADERRTEITASEGEIDLEDMIADNPMAISLTRSGYLKRTPLTVFRQQGRGGIGVTGMDLKDDDYVEQMFTASMHDYVLFITSVGKIYRLKVYELPEGSRTSKGRALVNLLPLREGERVKAIYRTRTYDEGKYLLMATKNGIVKKTEFGAYNTVLKADGIIALKVREDDELIDVVLTSGDDDLLLVSANGQACRFHEENVRPMGRTASGVRGMGLREGDEVIAATLARDERDLLVITEKGFGKRTKVQEYPRKGRGTKGVITMKNIEERGKLVGALSVRPGDGLLIITTEGQITRQAVDQISRIGRSTQGVGIMRMKEGHRIASIARVIDHGVEEDGEQEQLDTDSADGAPANTAPAETEATDVADDTGDDSTDEE
jgi:DNA gyrase subunit A